MGNPSLKLSEVLSYMDYFFKLSPMFEGRFCLINDNYGDCKIVAASMIALVYTLA